MVVTFQRYEIEHDSWGGFQPVRAIVKGQYKLVLNLLHSDELYDLERDPAEVCNLIDDPGVAGVRDALHDRLLDWMYEKRDPFRGPVWERRPWRDSRRLQWRGVPPAQPMAMHQTSAIMTRACLRRASRRSMGRSGVRRADGFELQHCRAENRQDHRRELCDVRYIPNQCIW